MAKESPTVDKGRSLVAKIQLPAMLTVGDEDVYDPADMYGDPVKKIIIVSYGDHEVARYELKSNGFGDFYLEPNSYRRYDTPEEFLAEKLKKLFALVD